MPTTKYKSFLGMNTRLPDTAMRTKDGRWVRDALNVIFANDGSARRMRSIDLVHTLAGAHSIFEDMLVIGGVLYKFTLQPFTQTMLRVLSSDDKMSYCRIGSRVYMSNGTDGLLRTSAGVTPWAMEAPPAPTAAYSEAGSFQPGRYNIALTFSRSDEESPLSELCFVEATAIGGFTVDLPTDGIPEGATHINVFISGVDGAIPMLAKTAAVGENSVSLTTLPAEREAPRRIETPMPPGTRLFEHNGRLCVVSGSVVYISVPYRFGYCEQGSGYVAFHSDVRVAVSNQNGVFVATSDKTVFLAGKDIAVPDEVPKVLPFGGVPGTEFNHPSSPLVGWFSERGVVFGSADGSVEEVMSQIKVVGAPESGASHVIVDDEVDAVLSCGWCVNTATKAVSRYDSEFESASGDLLLTTSGISALGSSSLNSRLNFGKENFAAYDEVRFETIRIGAKSAGPLAMEIGAKKQVYTYVARSFSDELSQHRIDPGQGLRSHWFDLTLTNPDGVDFVLATVSFETIM